MQYSNYAYLYPPRPETKIPKQLLQVYENRGFWAQKKKNGTCTVVFAKGDTVIFKTRHNDDHKMWTPKPEHVQFFRGFKDWNVFTAELLHSKVTNGPKDFLYIFDQIVRDGVHQVGTTFAERQELLHDTWRMTEDSDDLYLVNPNVGIAKAIDSDFVKVYDNLKPEDEGLVLKNPNARLAPCLKEGSNDNWQVKCRIGHKNYSF